ncbi:MAG TPA: lasso peptide biosynthesis B2 protein [Bryobacteraceae bacterium]|jgi:hypothetical protein|nr:lasso peptide biosynthesis B2 protein [Bryobacteraceae bacterium]
MGSGFLPASTVRHAEVDRLRVILDLRTNSYKVLDDAASALWAVLLGEADALSSLESLSRRYAVDEAHLQKELMAFAQRCVEEGLLVTMDSPSPPAYPSTQLSRAHRIRPATLRALACLMSTKRALAREGFAKTYDRYAGFSAASSKPDLDRLLRAFSRAEHFFIARRAPRDCLLRSLSLFRFLQSANVCVQHVIGVRRFPFGAHAWVEYNGAPILDDDARQYTPLARIGSQLGRGANHQ